MRQRTDEASIRLPEWADDDARLGNKLHEADMTPEDYRIESANSIAGPLLPVSGSSEYLVRDGAMAVVMAAQTLER